MANAFREALRENTHGHSGAPTPDRHGNARKTVKRGVDVETAALRAHDKLPILWIKYVAAQSITANIDAVPPSEKTRVPRPRDRWFSEDVPATSGDLRT